MKNGISCCKNCYNRLYCLVSNEICASKEMELVDKIKEMWNKVEKFHTLLPVYLNIRKKYRTFLTHKPLHNKGNVK